MQKTTGEMNGTDDNNDSDDHDERADDDDDDAVPNIRWLGTAVGALGKHVADDDNC